MAKVEPAAAGDPVPTQTGIKDPLVRSAIEQLQNEINPDTTAEERILRAADGYLIGVTGVTGATGATAVAGVTYAGLTGPTGVTGQRGASPTGPTGMQGARGPTGP